MTEKDMFLNSWEREFGITMNVLKHFPAEKADFKPTTEKTKSAKDLATVFVTDINVVANGAVSGEVDFAEIGRAPKIASYPEVLSAYDAAYRSVTKRISNMSEADWNATLMVPVGPGKMGPLRKGDLLWSTLMDGIHHRGQFSVYLRLVGAKVPSIYGPSADEPWA